MTTVSPSHLAFLLGISARWIFELTRRGVLAKDPQTGDYGLEANVEAFLAHTRQREAERAAQTEASLSAVLFRASQVLIATHRASSAPTGPQPSQLVPYRLSSRSLSRKQGTDGSADKTSSKATASRQASLGLSESEDSGTLAKSL